MIKPMLAKAVGDQVPTTPGLLYEPKWDGFRCLVFRDEQVILQSRKEEDFSYLFPEVVAACQNLPAGTTLDGELVIVGDSGLEFDLLSNRIRPRSEAGGWKIQELSQATPAQYVAFDVLRWQGEDVSQRPFAERRQILEGIDLPSGVHLTPITDDPAVAQEWFDLFEGAGLDGVVCKSTDQPYSPENGRCSRSSMCAPPTSWLPAGDRTRMRPPTDRRCSEPCCSVCTTRREPCTTSARPVRSAGRTGSLWPRN